MSDEHNQDVATLPRGGGAMTDGLSCGTCGELVGEVADPDANTPLYYHLRPYPGSGDHEPRPAGGN
jgi:hypothetical protein